MEDIIANGSCLTHSISDDEFEEQRNGVIYFGIQIHELNADNVIFHIAWLMICILSILAYNDKFARRLQYPERTGATILELSRVVPAESDSYSGGGDHLMELVLQNGQVATQTQNQRPSTGGCGFVADIPIMQFASTSHAGTGKEVLGDDGETGWRPQPQQQYFGQDDEMSLRLKHPIDDLDADFYSHLLYSATTAPHSEYLPPLPPSFRPLQPQFPVVPPQNFLNFSRVESVPSSSMQAPREYTRVDSTEMLNPTVVQTCELTPVVAGEAPQFYGWNVGGTSGASLSNAGKNIACGEATPSVHGLTLSAVEERKRRDRELEKNDCRSGDADEHVRTVKGKSQKPTTIKKARATEVHNLSERKRRDKINSKLNQLQALIPGCNKVHKASMLDDAIEYIKSLQLQVKINNMRGNGMVPIMYPGTQQQYMGMMGMGGDMGAMNLQMMQYPPPGFSLQAGGAASSFTMQPFPIQPVPVPVPANTERTPLVSAVQQYSTITSLPMQQGLNHSWLSTPSEVDPYQHLTVFQQPQVPIHSYFQTRAVVLPTTHVPSTSGPKNQKTG